MTDFNPQSSELENRKQSDNLDERVEVEAHGEVIKFDFNGSDPKANKNMREQVDYFKGENADKSSKQKITGEVKLFDIHTRDQRRSLAFRIRISAPDRTLTDEEISQVRERCIEATEELGAVPRI